MNGEEWAALAAWVGLAITTGFAIRAIVAERRTTAAANQINALHQQIAQAQRDIADAQMAATIKFRIDPAGAIRSGGKYTLRNVGTETATQVDIDPRPSGLVLSQLPTTFAPGQGHPFELVRTLNQRDPDPTEVRVVCAERKPELVAIPLNPPTA